MNLSDHQVCKGQAFNTDTVKYEFLCRNLKARKASTTSDANFNMAEYLEQKKQKENCCT